MATVRTSQSYNVGYIRVLSRPGGALVHELQLRATATVSAAKQRLRESPQRIDTGLLLNSIQSRIYYKNGWPVARIGTDVRYGAFVHDGTRYMEANHYLRDGLIRAARRF